MAKRALFCQILQRAAYHYRTLTSFELFSDSIGIILTHRWHWIYLYEKQTQQTTRLIFSWTRNMEIWTTISHNIWMLKLWLLSQILSSVYWIVLYILNVYIYIYIYFEVCLTIFPYYVSKGWLLDPCFQNIEKDLNFIFFTQLCIPRDAMNDFIWTNQLTGVYI